MSAKLIIEELPLSASKNEISEFFSAMGSVVSINESDVDASAHAWIIEMGSFEEATGIVEQLDGIINIRLAA